MTAIFKREVRSSFHGMIGYVLTAFMLAATAIYFVALNLGYGLTDFGYYTLYRTTFVLLLYIPVLTMRSFAEERRTRTDQLLLTSPVSVWEIVLGKFFALCVIFALPCLADAVMILVLAALGATGTATLANLAALLCYYLMGCAAIAIGVFLSSLTENQIIAAVAGVAALLLAYAVLAKYARYDPAIPETPLPAATRLGFAGFLVPVFLPVTLCLTVSYAVRAERNLDRYLYDYD